MSATEFYKRLSATAVVVALVAVAVAAPAAEQSLVKDGCESSCGAVSIPYPFGTSDNCSMGKEFLVACNKTVDPPKVKAILNGTVEVINISLAGEMTVMNQRAMQCYDSNGTSRNLESYLQSNQFGRNRISSTKNKMTVVGCDSLGLISGDKEKLYLTGCVTFCYNITDVTNGSCDGVGCCQSSLPSGIENYNLSVASIFNHTSVHEFNPCDFIVQDGWYNFSSADLLDMRQTQEFPMVLDWSIGNQTCQQARENGVYACMGKSNCTDADNGFGYKCLCSQGYSGNPYLHECIDIDECEGLHDCHEKAFCTNTVGNYTCNCQKGYHGDGFKTTGSGCTADQKNSTSMIVGLSISTSLLALLCVGLLILWRVKRRKLQQLRQKFFHQNGGTMMLQQLSGYGGTTTATKIFTEEDLKKATKDFHESRIIGQGGQGTVYKGNLADDQVVAIKKARIGDESQVRDFVNEVALLFNVSHKNVVKLLGCCFETQVPTLIYEYVSHGSLLDQLKRAETAPFPWELRLKIATETAEALWYLHSQLSTPIIHRDIKSANILLDKNYTAKVSDFGASRLVQQDNESQKDNTAVQGTIGYLDPEYIITEQLNEKSDVYSFGVVLVELLAGISVFDFRRSNPSKSLVIHVLAAFKSNNFVEVLDPQIATEKNMEELKTVAALARSCVSDSGEERPTMKLVLSALEGLRQVEKSPVNENGGGDVYNEEEYMLRDFSDAVHDADTSKTAGYDSMKALFTFNTTKAR